MNVERQYIGARYVPVFYNNPDGSAEWKAGIAYDPLTIVTYLNQSYTSKIPVPASVGNPQLNPDYWTLTGNYNAQVAEYSKEVKAAIQDVNDSENQFKQQVNTENSQFKSQINADFSDFKTQTNQKLANLSGSNPQFVSSIEEMSDHNVIYVLTTTGALYYYNGSNFVSSGIIYGSYSNGYLSRTITDADNLLISSLSEIGSYSYRFTSLDQVQDIPWNTPEITDYSFFIVWVLPYHNPEYKFQILSGVFNENGSNVTMQWMRTVKVNSPANRNNWIQIASNNNIPDQIYGVRKRIYNYTGNLSDLRETGSYAISLSAGSPLIPDAPDYKLTGDTGYMTMFVLPAYPSNGFYQFLKMESSNTGLFYRLISGDTVNPWVQFQTSTFTAPKTAGFRQRISNYSGKLSDINEYGVYCLNQTTKNLITDLPDVCKFQNGPSFINLVNEPSFLSDYVNQTIQIYYQSGTGTIRKEFWRYVDKKNNVNTAWNSVSNGTTVAVCGDSFCEAYNSSLMSMARLLADYGYSTTDYSKSGADASEWWDQIGKNLLNSHAEVYIVALGLNEEQAGNGTITDDPATGSGATFCAGMKYIIEHIQDHDNTARIILWAMDAWYSEDKANLLSQIGEMYGLETYIMKRDKNIPMRLGGKYKTNFPLIKDEYVNKVNKAFVLNDGHPNNLGRKLLAEYWSTII